MKTSELLESARKLIDKPEKLSKGSFAKHNNRSTYVGSEEANRFCAIGAVKHAAAVADTVSFAAENLLDEVSFDKRGLCTISVNDLYGHPAIMELYDEAIWRALLKEGAVFPLKESV